MFDLTATLFPDTAPARLRPDSLAPLQQSVVYARAVRMVGGRARYLAFPGSGALLVERHLPLFGDVGLISRGPADLGVETARSMRETCRTNHLIINAEDDIGARALSDAGFWRIGRPRVIAELDLHPSIDDMAHGLHQKFRNRLRHSIRQNLHVKRTVFPPDRRHWLLQAQARAARRLGYQPVPAIMMAAISAAKPGAAQLFVARHRTMPVAAMLFIRHGRMATYQVGWGNSAGRAMSAGNLVMWRAMVALQSMGVERLDLGEADAVVNPGLSRFKRGTGATPRALGGTWMSSAALPMRKSQPSRFGTINRLEHLAGGTETSVVSGHRLVG
jgi:hypothetical protein